MKSRVEQVSKTEDLVENYFNTIVTKNIISEVWNNKLSLAELYPQLAHAYGKCEWIKEYFNETQQPFSEDLMAKLITSFRTHSSADSYVPMGYFIGSEGIAEYLNDPIKNYEGDLRQMGLAKIKKEYRRYDLHLPLHLINNPSILTELESHYQQLLECENFFDYLQLSSQLLFGLFNFPTNREKNFSIAAKLIHTLAQLKFNCSSEFIPANANQIAYFETINQFTSFFIITAVANYCANLNIIPDPEALNTQLNQVMSRSSVFQGQEKLEVWSKLKGLISKVLATNNTFTTVESSCLNSILKGKILFRRHSPLFLKYNHFFTEKDFDLVKFIPTLTNPEDKKYFEKLLELDTNIVKNYFDSLGNPTKEENLNQGWEDLLYFQVHRHTPKAKFDYYHVDYVPIYHTGYIEPAQRSQFTELLALCEINEEQSLFAIKNGMSLYQLNKLVKESGFTKEMVAALTSRAACISYNINKKIEPSIFYTNSLENTEMRILNAVALKFSKEFLAPISCPEIRKVLLRYLDPILLEQHTLPTLVGDTVLDTKKKLLSAYHRAYQFMEPNLITSFINKLTPEQIDDQLNSLIKEDRLSIRPAEFLYPVDVEPYLIEGCTQKEQFKEGSFGAVFHCNMDNNPNPYVIKKINQGSSLQELSVMILMKKMNHPNIVPLIGAMEDSPTSYRIVMPYIGNGNLAKHMKNGSLNDLQKLTIQIDIATGLKYMHELNLLHNDLHAGNILFDHSYKASLCDFGLTALEGSVPKDFSASNIHPIEVHHDKASLSKKSDIYSMGINFMYMFTESQPFYWCTPGELVDEIEEANFDELPASCPTELAALIHRCLSQSIKERPELDEVKAVLNRLRLVKQEELRTNQVEKLLFIACQYGDLSVMQNLLAQKSINFNQKRNGETLLTLACKYGYLDIVLLLIKRGVPQGFDFNQTETQGKTALYIACENGRLDIAQLLLQIKEVDRNKPDHFSISPFLIACKNGHLAIAQELIKQGVNINKGDNMQRTPLYVTCQKGDLNIAQELANQKGVDLNINSPLVLVCEKGRLDIVQVLVKQGADINKSNVNGLTPLQAACSYGHLDIVRELARNNVNLNEPNEFGNSPLYNACQYGHMKVVEFLSNLPKVKVDSLGKENHTPLQVACLSPHTLDKGPLFQALLNNGASLIHRNDKKQTALDIALEQNNSAGIRVLLRFSEKNRLSAHEIMSAFSLKNALAWSRRNNLPALINYLLGQKNAVGPNSKFSFFGESSHQIDCNTLLQTDQENTPHSGQNARQNLIWWNQEAKNPTKLQFNTKGELVNDELLNSKTSLNCC